MNLNHKFLFIIFIPDTTDTSQVTTRLIIRHWERIKRTFINMVLINVSFPRKIHRSTVVGVGVRDGGYIIGILTSITVDQELGK